MFDTLRGGHFTVLVFGSKAIGAVGKSQWRDAQGSNSMVQVVAIHTEHIASDESALVDEAKHARAAYGVADDENVTFLIRPDGYVGHVASDDWVRSLSKYLASVAGLLLNQGKAAHILRVMNG